MGMRLRASTTEFKEYLQVNFSFRSEFTFYGESVGLTGDVDEDPAPPLCVVTPTQVWNCLHALLVYIHVTC